MHVWEVGYFLNGEKVNLVIVDGDTGVAKESWTGAAVDWPMARGKPGSVRPHPQRALRLDPAGADLPARPLGLPPLAQVGPSRPRSSCSASGSARPSSTRAEIGVSVPLYYPPLVYLLIRMLWIGFRGHGRDGGAGEGLRPSMPVWLMTVAVVGLLVLRLAANVADSGVIDVGYAGVVGADKIGDVDADLRRLVPRGQPDAATPTGPANYFAYVPFEQVFPWGGSWDDLPAAHAAAIFFDLFTVAGLFALGLALVRRRQGSARRRRRGCGRARSRAAARAPRRPSPPAGGLVPRRRGNIVGLTLVFAWVAYPYTTFSMQGNSNDELISALLVWSLAAFASPFARGSPARHRDDGEVRAAAAVPALRRRRARVQLPHSRRRRAARLLRPMLFFLAGFALFAGLFLAYPAVDPGLRRFLGPDREEPARPREPVQHLGPGRPRSGSTRWSRPASSPSGYWSPSVRAAARSSRSAPSARR